MRYMEAGLVYFLWLYHETNVLNLFLTSTLYLSCSRIGIGGGFSFQGTASGPKMKQSLKCSSGHQIMARNPGADLKHHIWTSSLKIQASEGKSWKRQCRNVVCGGILVSETLGSHTKHTVSKRNYCMQKFRTARCIQHLNLNYIAIEIL